MSISHGLNGCSDLQIVSDIAFQRRAGIVRTLGCVRPKRSAPGSMPHSPAPRAALIRFWILLQARMGLLAVTGLSGSSMHVMRNLKTVSIERCLALAYLGNGAAVEDLTHKIGNALRIECAVVFS